MSRSWPDLRPTLHLAIGRRAQAQVHWFGRRLAGWELPADMAVSDSEALLGVIKRLLDAMPPQGKLPAPKCVSLTVPDNLARLQWLPWTPTLMQPDELRQFAVERFEMAGLKVREGWAVQAAWCRHDGATLAYAVPHALLDVMQTQLGTRGLRLRSAVPASAATHYRRLTLNRQSEIYLLHGGACVSALRYERGRLVEFLSEACRNEDGLKRVLARLRLSCEVETISRWTLSALDPIALQPLLGADAAARIRSLDLCGARFA